jgi:hypothetical protein
MVNRICPKCKLSFDRKSTFDKHINKKFDCSHNNINNTNINNSNELECAKKANFEICRNLQEFAGICKNEKNTQQFIKNPNYSNITKLNFSETPEISEMTDINYNSTYADDDCFNCNYCNKKFSSKYTLSRHLNDNCKIKKTNDNEKENIFKLLLEKEKLHKEEIEELKKQNKLLLDKIDKLINNKNISKSSKTINNNNNSINKSITNNINSNNTQNIVMVNFGKEDLSIIDKKIFLERIVKGRVSGVKIPEEILKIIHFNPNYPQLSNIYISDINREKCMVWEDGDWKLSPIDKIPEVIDKVVLYSNEMNDDLREEYPNNKKINDRLDVIKKYNNMNDSEYIEELREEIENNKDLIKRCEEFQKLTYDTFKTTLYNEGKKIKKNVKI